MRLPLPLAFAGLIAILPAQAPPAVATGVSPTSTAPSRPQVAALMQQHGGGSLQQVEFDRPHADGPLWAIGQAWKASFDGGGFTAIPFFGAEAPRNFPLRFELASAAVGGQPLPLVTGEPTVVGDSVHTPRGGCREVVATDLQSLEQSFVFDSLQERGAVSVDVRIAGDFTTSPIDGGLRFANAFGHVDYTHAVAVDAAGRRLALPIAWDGACAHMEIPAAFVEQATFPLVLDPVLNFWYLLASGQTQLQHDSDVASFQANGGRTLIVYQRQWSLTDQDCWGILFDGNLGLVHTDFSIDFTGDDWLKVAVAANNYAQNFLVVAEIRVGLVWYIGGRGIDGAAGLGNLITIERENVVGLAGQNHAPDVGSDPYFGVGRYTVVFVKRAALQPDAIYMKQVTTAGGLVTTNPVFLRQNSIGMDLPSISKSCGQSNGPTAAWLVTWQETWLGTPNDREVWGRFVNWNGALIGTNFPIAITVADETAPCAGSPFDAGGARYWPVAFETAVATGLLRDISCKIVRGDGTIATQTTISANVLPSTDDLQPAVDSDGTRFVVTSTVAAQGWANRVEAVTCAFLPGSGTVRFDERSDLGAGGSAVYLGTDICADYSGGSGISPRYFVSFTEQISNTFNLVNYGGYHPGSFFSTFASQCGTQSISVSGSPVVGQSVNFQFGGTLAGSVLGLPGYVPLNAYGCNCVLGVNQVGSFFGNTLTWNVPNSAAYVGLTLSVQGFTLAGTHCLGSIDLSDTIDFTIR